MLTKYSGSHSFQKPTESCLTCFIFLPLTWSKCWNWKGFAQK